MIAKFKAWALTAMLVVMSLLVAVPAMAQDDPVAQAAQGFQSTFSGHATTIGVALLSAAFVALVWKWVKGMAFS